MVHARQADAQPAHGAVLVAFHAAPSGQLEREQLVAAGGIEQSGVEAGLPAELPVVVSDDDDGAAEVVAADGLCAMAGRQMASEMFKRTSGRGGATTSTSAW